VEDGLEPARDFSPACLNAWLEAKRRLKAALHPRLRLARGRLKVQIQPVTAGGDGDDDRDSDHDRYPLSGNGLHTPNIYGELAAADAPFELVSVTDTLVTAVALPVTLKGTVSLNWPPVAFEAELLNQVVYAEVSETTSVDTDNVLPLETENVKLPLDTSRVLE